MSSFGYDPSPLGRMLQWLLRSFRVGTFFGVHVRMYWVALILMPLLFLGWVPGDGVEVLVRVAICFVGLFTVIWTHEMGHIACGWRYHIRTDLITLGPLGGLAHMNAPASTPWQELWISLAGPAVHLVWLLVFWPIEWLLPDSAWFTWYGFAVWYLVALNQGLLLFNLLPVFPLDGGRVLRALLSLRVHPNRATLWAATVGMIGGGIMILLALTRVGLSSSIGLLIGLRCISESLRERRVAQHVLIYQQHRREPWEMDADAWKHGGTSQRERRPGWFARWRADRAEHRASARTAADAELERQVDAVLDRLHQVGMTGLSATEKAVLKRAAQRRRGAG